MTEVFLDLNQVRRYRKTFEPETPLDLIFPRESSAMKIGLNIVTSTLIAGLWAKGWQRFKSLKPGFALNYTRSAFVFSIVYFPSNELMSVLLPKYFRIENFFANNLSSAAFTFATGCLLPGNFFAQNKLTMAKHALHIFTYSLYFDISVALIRDKMLVRKNSIFAPNETSTEEKLRLFKIVQESNKFSAN